MHSIRLVGCATVGQRLPCEPLPAALWWKHHVSYRVIISGPSGQLVGFVQTSGRHGGCWHGKGSQRSIQMGRFNGIIQVMNPLEVLFLVEHLSWSQELEAVRAWHMFAQRHPRKLVSFLDAVHYHGDMLDSMTWLWLNTPSHLVRFIFLRQSTIEALPNYLPWGSR